MYPSDDTTAAQVVVAQIAVARDRPAGRWSVGTLTYTKGSLAALFAWLLWGDFAWNLKERAIIPIAQLMLQRFTAPIWLVGLLIGSIPSGIGLILGPIISVKSDRHRGRWGRRIPFILFPTPIIVITIFGLAITPEISDWLHHVMGRHAFSPSNCRIVVFSVLWTLMEIAAIVANSLVGALINDVVPQAVIGRFSALFRIVSLIVGIFFFRYLMGKADEYYRSLLIVMALAYAAGFTLMCLKVKEGQYPPPPPREEAHAGWLSPLVSYLKECFSKPFYLCFFMAGILGGMSAAPVNTYSLYHAHSVGMSDTVYGKCAALSYFFSLVLAYPLGILADRFHPLRLCILSMAAYTAVTAFGFFYAVTPGHFFVALLLHTVLAGCYLTSRGSINQRLFPRSRFAELGSAGGLIYGIFAMLMPPALGAIIQWRNQDYRCVFLIGSIIAGLATLTYIVLFRWFIALGGDDAYVAP